MTMKLIENLAAGMCSHPFHVHVYWIANLQEPKALSGEVSCQTERYVPQQVIDLTSELNVMLRDSEELRDVTHMTSTQMKML